MIKRFDYYYIASICILIALMILLPKMVAIGIILLALTTIVGVIQKKVVFRLNVMNVIFVLFYLLYLFYTLFTRNSQLATSSLEYKMSFVVFPLLLSFQLKEKPSLKFPALIFVFSTLLLGILGLIKSSLCYYESGMPLCWLTGYFSYIHHPSYVCMYFSLAIMCVWYLESKAVLNKISAGLISFFLVCFIFLTLSLAGMLFLLFMVCYFTFIFLYKKFGKITAYITLIFLPVFLVTVITFEPHVKWEFMDAKDKAIDYFNDPTGFLKDKKENYSGSNSRLIMWTVAAQGIKEYPLGIGTGNTDEYLGHKLRSLGLYELADQNLNPHNQYLQTWLEIGVFGFIVLLAIVIYPFMIGIVQKNYILIISTLCLAFNMLFESILQRQSGIVFYTFWICLILNYSIKQSEVTLKNKECKE